MCWNSTFYGTNNYKAAVADDCSQVCLFVCYSDLVALISYYRLFAQIHIYYHIQYFGRNYI